MDYPGVRALEGVSFDLYGGEIHALIGENGAGKSTLIRILSGDVRPAHGSLEIDGQKRLFRSPADSRACGIATIFQELMTVPALSVAENIVLGNEPPLEFCQYGYSRRRAERRAAAVLETLGMTGLIDPRAQAESLSTARRQVIEIARALIIGAPVIILDEPTAALAGAESATLLQILRTLRNNGVAILFISHRLEEVKSIADRITVLRNGRVVGTAGPGTDTDDLIELMVGQPIGEMFPERGRHSEEIVLETRSFSRSGVFEDISFRVARGEILGFAGLVGAGRTELMRSVFGADPIDRGTLIKSGKSINLANPSEAIAAGLAYLPEDRKHQGLVLALSGHENLALASLASYVSRGVLSWGKLRHAAAAVSRRLKFRGRLEAPARTNSGGNQQKLVIGKWLLSNASVLIFDEPTRGIDVGAKVEVYRIIRDLAAAGTAVIVVSSELSELINLCHRIVVMSAGRIQDEMSAKQFDERRILRAAFAGHVSSRSNRRGLPEIDAVKR
jgi:ABC-type sugar transport system ATPase subunit